MSPIESQILDTIFAVYGLPGVFVAWMVWQSYRSRKDDSPSKDWWRKLDAMDSKLDNVSERVATIEGRLNISHRD